MDGKGWFYNSLIKMAASEQVVKWTKNAAAMLEKQGLH